MLRAEALAVDAAVLLVAAGAAVATSRRVGRLVAAWLLALAAAVWPVLDNGVLEGPVLVRVDARHGLTAVDLVAVVALLLAAALLLGNARTPGRLLAPPVLVVVAGLGAAAAYRWQG